jgi:MOSC domain-containing protein YiiM
MLRESDLLLGEILAVSSSARKGIPKLPQPEVLLLTDHGIEGDRHAGSRKRQVSLLEQEVLDDLAAQGMPVGPGVLAENLLVRGLPFAQLCPGDWLRAGGEVLLEVVEPRTPCKQLTPVDARLPAAIEGRAGILCRVLQGGRLAPGDRIERVED